MGQIGQGPGIVGLLYSRGIAFAICPLRTQRQRQTARRMAVEEVWKVALDLEILWADSCQWPCHQTVFSWHDNSLYVSRNFPSAYESSAPLDPHL